MGRFGTVGVKKLRSEEYDFFDKFEKLIKNNQKPFFRKEGDKSVYIVNEDNN